MDATRCSALAAGIVAALLLGACDRRDDVARTAGQSYLAPPEPATGLVPLALRQARDTEAPVAGEALRLEGSFSVPDDERSDAPARR